MRVLVVDDQAVVRWGLRGILVDGLGSVDVGEAANGSEAFAALAAGHWDVVVMDLALRGRGGVDLLAEVKLRHPATPVLVLSLYPEALYAVRALRAGAAGYLTKDAPPATVLAAIRRIHDGGRYISEVVAEQLALVIAEGNEALLHGKLSDRELEVLRGIGAGKTVGGIAAELSLSVKTVSTYRARILTKLGLRSNAELMRYALEHGL
jgi:two-component system, NarL family, invasion response regulator UvrY